MYSLSIVTLSDRSYTHKREDASGPLLKELFENEGFHVVSSHLLPDDEEMIRELLTGLSHNGGCDLVITTGGTGISKRDVTPEATKAVIERELPGFMEWVRMKSMEKTPRAILSRGVAGISNNTVIINFPGSPKACRDYFGYLIESIPHAIDILRGDVKDCNSQSGKA